MQICSTKPKFSLLELQFRRIVECDVNKVPNLTVLPRMTFWQSINLTRS